MYKILATTAVLTTTLLSATLLTPQAAFAATECKTPVSAHGAWYATKATAKAKADIRWGLKAASIHGASWGLMSQARQKSYDIKGKTFNANGKVFYQATLTAKPCKKTTICKGKVQARGAFYFNKNEAKSRARTRWGLAAAAKYGASFGLWSRAKGRSTPCQQRPGGKAWQCEARATACK